MTARLPLRYRKGMKYRVEDYSMKFQTDFRLAKDIEWRWHPLIEGLHMTKGGLLTVGLGYVWDGVSGPVRDRKSNFRAGCLHDALYQLMRRGRLDHEEWDKADLEYAKQLKQDGAWWITIKKDMIGLAFAYGFAADPKEKYKIHTAP